MESDEQTTDVRSPGRAGRAARLLKLLALVLAIAGGSYWYVRQPRDQQAEIQDKAGKALERTAVVVGHAVSNVVDHVREADWSEVQHSASGVAQRIKAVDWGGAASNVGVNVGRAGRAVREKVDEHRAADSDGRPAAGSED